LLPQKQLAKPDCVRLSGVRADHRHAVLMTLVENSGRLSDLLATALKPVFPESTITNARVCRLGKVVWF